MHPLYSTSRACLLVSAPARYSERMGGKQKLLYVITKGEPWGGAQKYVYDLAVRVPKRAFDVAVALGDGDVLKRELEAAGIRTISLPALGRDVRLARELRAFRELRDLFVRERPDILHLNSSKAGGLGALAGRTLGVPRIVFTAHGLPSNENRSLAQRVLLALLTWLTVLSSHATIAVSRAIKSQLARYPFVARKLTVIHSGVPPAPLFGRQEARAALARMHESLGRAVSSGDVWIGTVAELHESKGVDYEIEAMDELVREHPNVRLLVLGEGEERARLEQLISEKGLNSNVFLLGYVRAASRYLTAFDIFVLASHTEALSLALIEAGQAGLPVVATSVGGIPEVVRDMESGMLVRPRQPSEIARALSYLISNPEKCGQFGSALRADVTERFRIERALDATLDVYRATRAPRRALGDSKRAS